MVGLPPAEMVIHALERHERRLSAYADPAAAPAKCVTLFQLADNGQGYRLKENIKVKSVSPPFTSLVEAQLHHLCTLRVWR